MTPVGSSPGTVCVAPNLDVYTGYHGGNLARLVAAKRTYDPDRLFRFPQAV
jgi:FAD/FMN-containing dehydrogenase